MKDITLGSSDVNDLPTPFPNVVEDDLSPDKEKDGRPRKKSENPSGHKRSLSGNIFSRLTFLRTNSDDKENGIDTDRLYPGRIAIPEAQGRRKRKGSLRKTVLGKARDRKGSDLRKSPLTSPVSTPSQVQDGHTTPRFRQDISNPTSPESPPKWPFRSLSRVSIPSLRSSVASVEPASSATSMISPTMQTDPSTDDEELTLPQISTFRKPPSSNTDSYFPIQEPVRRIFSRRGKSPLASQSASVARVPNEYDEWDYSETAFWGYVILIVTWVVFVVGMGSCFGVWSWAWDVGETPYAPPELEDDASLPIIGYYPALLVLTCVMAWVWVVVAWIGMKYFRHADLRGDDG